LFALPYAPIIVATSPSLAASSPPRYPSNLKPIFTLPLINISKTLLDEVSEIQLVVRTAGRWDAGREVWSGWSIGRSRRIPSVGGVGDWEQIGVDDIGRATTATTTGHSALRTTRSKTLGMDRRTLDVMDGSLGPIGIRATRNMERIRSVDNGNSTAYIIGTFDGLQTDIGAQTMVTTLAWHRTEPL
jgi:hypothetical protein